MQRKNIQVLLIQNRNDDMKHHEVECLKKVSGFSDDQLTIVNIDETEPALGLLSGIDLMIIGGSGHSYVSKDSSPVLDQLIELILEAHKKKIPIFGMCYGGHVLTKAFGGQVVYDQTRKEVGTKRAWLTEEGKQDPVFSHLPEEFSIQVGHNDQMEELPKGALNLCFSELADKHAWTFPDHSVYAIQFHPELDQEDTFVRMDYYFEDYIKDPELLKKLKEESGPSPETVKIFGYFLDYVFGEEN